MDDDQPGDEQLANLTGLSMGEVLALRANQTAEVARLRPDAAGKYAWDRWRDHALAAGVGKDLATLGRAVMREAVQHDWEDDLKAECGWDDDGAAMLQLALTAQSKAEARWQYLLDTDGERGKYNET